MKSNQLPSLARENVAGTWLSERLESAGVTQTQLATALDVSPPFVNQFLAGEWSIPRRCILSIQDRLRLSLADLQELIALIDIQDAVGDIKTTFLGAPPQRKPRTPKIPKPPNHDGEIKDFFENPISIYLRLLSFVETVAGKDKGIAIHATPAGAIRLHVMAALRVVEHIQRFLSEQNCNLLNSKNIFPHLVYPHNYYLAFFLDSVGDADGPDVQHLKGEIVVALIANAEFRASGSKIDSVIAHHAIHMLNRHAPSSLRGANPGINIIDNIQEKRMVLFGEVFRLGDLGPFEGLSEQIKSDEKLTEAVIAFDGLHYGDYNRYADKPDRHIVPINSILRHLQTLADPRKFMRILAAVRLNVILDRYEDRIQENEVALQALRDRIEHLMEIKLDDGEEAAVFKRICATAKTKGNLE